MLYYRYRPGTPLSMKELIYDEMYFSSVSECNDPYEGKLFAVFEKNHEYWKKLINIAIKNTTVHSSAVKISSSLVERLIDCCVAMSPIDVNTFNTLNYKDFRLEVSIDDIFSDNQQTNIPSLLEAIDRIKNYVKINLPAEQYFVSFSKSRDNILMWSHYANKHRGYCLIFRPVDNKIMQDKRWIKRKFKFDTPQAFLSDDSIKFIIDEGFELKNVEYTSERIPPTNAFALLPHVIDPEHHSKEVNDAIKVAYSSYLRKHPVWKYEEESRLILFQGVPQNITKRTLSLSSHQRLFHYDPSHLVGIVLGAKMPSEQRKQIKEIVKQKVTMLHSESKEQNSPVNFTIFEARLSTDTIKIDMEPVKIYTSSKVFDKTQHEFGQFFDNWKRQNQWDSTELQKEELI